MQCLSAPTRNEVSREHARGEWLDVGIPSVKNLFKISSKRLILWSLLALSSVPLHLMSVTLLHFLWDKVIRLTVSRYNSAIFEAVSANEYYVFIVSSNFFNGAQWNQNMLSKPNFIGMGWPISQVDVNRRLKNFQQNITRTERLDTNASAIATYSNPYLTNRGDLLMISHALPDNRTNSSLLAYTGGSPAMSRYGDSRSGGHTNYWICSDHDKNDIAWLCDPNSQDPSSWTVLRYGAEYFLSEQTEEHCELLFSQGIMIVVIICNLIKAVVMVATVRTSWTQPLVTTGCVVPMLARWSSGEN